MCSLLYVSFTSVRWLKNWCKYTGKMLRAGLQDRGTHGSRDHLNHKAAN